MYVVTINYIIILRLYFWYLIVDRRLVVDAASAAAHKVVAGLDRRILLHLTEHTAWAHGFVDKPSPLVVFISVI
jgi:hypothetical protein